MSLKSNDSLSLTLGFRLWTLDSVLPYIVQKLNHIVAVKNGNHFGTCVKCQKTAQTVRLK